MFFVCFFHPFTNEKKNGPPKPRSKKISKPPRIHEALVWIGHPRSRPVPSMMVDDGWWEGQPVFVDPPHLGFFGPWCGVFGGGCFCCCCIFFSFFVLLLLFSVDVELFCVAFVVWLMGCFALGNSKNPYRKFQDEIANCFETKFLVDYLWFFASGIFVGG